MLHPGKMDHKLVCIDILASLNHLSLSDSSTVVGHLRQLFPLCSRYVRFALVLWLDNWPWFCTCGNYHPKQYKTTVAAADV